jgi:DNA-binding NarL/FixJ family response regulator
MTLRYTCRTGEGHLLIRVEPEQDHVPDTVLIDRFALSSREAEVLTWLSKASPSAISPLSTRTVKKYLEQFFQKLGVDNRTSAALMADRLLCAMH